MKYVSVYIWGNIIFVLHRYIKFFFFTSYVRRSTRCVIKGKVSQLIPICGCPICGICGGSSWCCCHFRWGSRTFNWVSRRGCRTCSVVTGWSRVGWWSIVRTERWEFNITIFFIDKWCKLNVRLFFNPVADCCLINATETFGEYFVFKSASVFNCEYTGVTDIGTANFENWVWLVQNVSLLVKSPNAVKKSDDLVKTNEAFPKST